MRKRVSQLLALAAAALIAMPVCAAPAADGAVVLKAPNKEKREAQRLNGKRAVSEQLLGTSVAQAKKAGESQFAKVKPFQRKSVKRAADAATAALPERMQGQLIYNDDWNQTGIPAYGIYGIAADGALTSVYENANMLGYYGAAYDTTNGIYRTNYIDTFLGYIFGAYSFWYQVDSDGQFSYLGMADLLGYDCFASSMAYDPVSGRIYGAFYNEEFSKICIGYQSSIYDSTHTMLIPQEDGGSWMAHRWMACGVDSKGEFLYAYTDQNNLVKVDIRQDKETFGQQTMIGNTGLSNNYATAGCVVDDVFYFALCTDSENAIYAIDLKTAKATLCVNFPQDVEFSSLYQAAPLADAKAPDAPFDAVANFNNGSMNGNITFSMPTVLYDGTPMTSKNMCYYQVEVYDPAGNLVPAACSYNGEASFGSTLVTEEYKGVFTQSGIYKFVIRAYTYDADGNKLLSPVCNLEAYIGVDVPAQIGDVTLTYNADKNSFTVEWPKVTEGAHAAMGAYFDPSKVTYTLTQYSTDNPAGKTTQNLKSTKWTETPNPAEPTSRCKYWYELQVVYNGVDVAGNEAVSNSWFLGSDPAPMSVEFDNAAALNDVIAYDENGDGITWYYDSYESAVAITYNSSEPMDDWLIMPCIYLEGGKYYEFYAEASSYSPYYPETIELYVGQGTTPAELLAGTQILEPTNLPDTKTTVSAGFIAPADGVYSFGLHGVSEAYMWDLYVYSMGVKAGLDGQGPAAVGNLQVVPDENGGGSVFVSFNVPTKTINGAALENLNRVEVYCNGTLAKIITEGINPGQYVKTIIDGLTTEQVYSISVVAYAEKTEGGVTTVYQGAPAKADLYVGITYPGAVENVVLSEEGNTGKVTLTWDAPTVDAQGYPMPAHVCKYEIYDMSGNLVAEVNYDEEWSTQLDASYGRFMYYIIYAYTIDPVTGNPMYGTNTFSNIIFVGKPYETPFVESVTDGVLSNPWLAENGWDLMNLSEQFGYDVDGVDSYGYFVCVSFDTEGNYLQSPKIDIAADAVNPCVSFYYYYFNPDNYQHEIQVGVSVDNGPFEVIDDIFFADAEDTEGWNRAVVSLEAYKGQTISVRFDCVRSGAIDNYGAYDQLIDAIDRIQIGDMFDQDLAANNIVLPASTVVNTPFDVEVNIFNDGLESVGKDFNVTLFRDGEPVQTQDALKGLASGKGFTFYFKDVLPVVYNTADYYATIEYANDQNKSNNSTPTASINVEQLPLPTTALDGYINNDGFAALSWYDAADFKKGTSEFADGFEDYTPWISVGNGTDWTTYDGDGMPVGGETLWPVQDEPNDFFVVDVEDTGIGSDYAHDGKNVLVSSYTEFGAKNDWLISPALEPNGVYELSFWARSTTDQFLESFAVLVSDTDNDHNSFDYLMGVSACPAEWTEFKIVLPEGTKYFAIVCYTSSDNSYYFFVDDVKVAPYDINLVGYNLYRDGVLINEMPLMELEYVDEYPVDGEYHYQASVLWDRGESAPDAGVYLKIATKVDSVLADGNVNVEKRNIIVTGAAGLDVTIVSLDGKLMAKATGSDKMSFPVEPGVYVVTIDGKATRVVVR